jgi:hypothetical protein
MFNSLHMLIIVVGHLFMCFIHVLGGGKAILPLFATCHVHSLIHFALEAMSCTEGHDRTCTTSWMQPHTLLCMQAEDMLHLHSYAFHVLLEEMCYHCFYWKFICYILFYSWFNIEVQF